jgi:hypothetical protein
MIEARQIPQALPLPIVPVPICSCELILLISVSTDLVTLLHVDIRVLMSCVYFYHYYALHYYLHRMDYMRRPLLVMCGQRRSKQLVYLV